jgi:hypothetical protein
MIPAQVVKDSALRHGMKPRKRVGRLAAVGPCFERKHDGFLNRVQDGIEAIWAKLSK